MLEDPIQKLETDICGPFQLYFFENLFGAMEKSKILEHKKLTKKIIEVLLNKMFTIESKQNEKAIKDYIETLDLTNEFQFCSRKTILIVDFGKKWCLQECKQL